MKKKAGREKNKPISRAERERMGNRFLLAAAAVRSEGVGGCRKKPLEGCKNAGEKISARNKSSSRCSSINSSSKALSLE